MAIAKGKIGNALTSTAADHVVAVAADIYDETAGKYQSEVNAGKVDKEVGKGLSSNDYSNAEKQKVSETLKKVFGNVITSNLESSGLSTTTPPTSVVGEKNTFISHTALTVNTSNPVELKKGEEISIEYYPNHNGLRTICVVGDAHLSPGDTATCVVVKQNALGAIEYTATEDCYVVYITYREFYALQYTIKLYDGIVDNGLSVVDGKLCITYNE